MLVVIDLLESPQKTALLAAAPAPRRHLQQQEEPGETQREQQDLQYKHQQNSERDQNKQGRGKYKWDPQQEEQEQQHRLEEHPQVKQGLRLPKTKRGAMLLGTDSSVPSLSSAATTTSHSPHNSLNEPQPVSAAPAEASVDSEGTFEFGTNYLRGNQMQGEAEVGKGVGILSPVRPQRASSLITAISSDRSIFSLGRCSWSRAMCKCEKGHGEVV